MKREKVFSLLISTALAFCISFGGVACIVTGFQLTSNDSLSVSDTQVLPVPVDMSALLVFCLLFSLTASAVLTFRRGGWFLLGGMALICGYLWRIGILEISLEAALYRISYTYDKAYRWGVIYWTTERPGVASVDLAFCAFAAIPAIITAWTVCRRKRSVLAVIAACILLGVCMIVTDTVPDIWCLMLLLTGLVLLVLTNTVRRRDAADGNRLTALLLVPAVLYMCLLFWAVPQDTYQGDFASTEIFSEWIQELGEMLGFNGSGNSQGVVDLADIGPKTEFHYPVMDVVGAEDGMLYLRGQALDVYDGKSWGISGAGSGTDSGWPAGEDCVTVGVVSISTRAGMPIQYFPYYPWGGSWPEDGRLIQGAIPNPSRDMEYSFSQKRIAGISQLKLTSQMNDQCLQLPEDTKRLAEAQLTRVGDLSGKSSRIIAQMIGNYVSGVARYDLNTPRMPVGEKDFALWFLRNAESGYCVHFATAATVLLRAAGVPARYVSGYAVRAVEDQEVTVTENRSHAWVEYFDPLRGWTVLDPTPADWYTEDPETVPPDTTQTEPTTEPTEPPAATVARPTNPATEPTLPPEETTAPVQLPKPGVDPVQKVDLSWIWTVLQYLLAPAALLAAVMGQYLLRRRLRSKKMHKGQPNQRVLARWQAVVRISRILKEEPPEQLLELAEKAKFSQHTLTASERMEFSRYLAQAEEKINKMPWCKRWLIKLLWAI